MRSREQIESDISATEEQTSAFNIRLDELYEELDNHLNTEELRVYAKQLKECVDVFVSEGFTQSEAVAIILKSISIAD